MLYEYTSASANNGSGFEGLGDNNLFWNLTTGFVLILARFLPIIGPVAIAGLLAGKKYIPASAGTLRTDSITFGIMTLVVILIVAALARSEEHTSELQSLMRISYAVFCLKKKKITAIQQYKCHPQTRNTNNKH